MELIKAKKKKIIDKKYYKNNLSDFFVKIFEKAKLKIKSEITKNQKFEKNKNKIVINKNSKIKKNENYIKKC